MTKVLWVRPRSGGRDGLFPFSMHLMRGIQQPVLPLSSLSAKKVAARTLLSFSIGFVVRRNSGISHFPHTPWRFSAVERCFPLFFFCHLRNEYAPWSFSGPLFPFIIRNIWWGRLVALNAPPSTRDRAPSANSFFPPSSRERRSVPFLFPCVQQLHFSDNDRVERTLSPPLFFFPLVGKALFPWSIALPVVRPCPPRFFFPPHTNAF